MGGTASAPQAPQRTAVSCPARACSKKWRSVSTGSVTAEERDEHGGGVAAQGVGEADPGAIHLAGAGLLGSALSVMARISAEVEEDRRHVGNAGGEDRPQRS